MTHPRRKAFSHFLGVFRCSSTDPPEEVNRVNHFDQTQLHSNEPSGWFDHTRVDDRVYFFDGRPSDSPFTNATAEDFRDPAEDFIAAIHEEIQNGYSFVPFIGAGFSVTAGIPMIRHLLTYLQR